MGVKINELVPATEIEFRELSDKVVAVDASLFLYQFITTIRQPDGTLLMDSKGNVTSHLVGLFSRTARLMQYGIKLAYVFDGAPPKLKAKEQMRRREKKIAAKEKYEAAVERKDIEEMKKYAGRTSRLSKEMIDESKRLVQALGLPVVQAPSEAEAQAAYIVKREHAYALATQDADALMFGALKLVRNLSFVGRRKQVNKLSYQNVKPEIVDLAQTLNQLRLDQDQLIALCMLVGTDYNTGGIRGIGPKNALRLVQTHGKNFDVLFKAVEWEKNFKKTEWEEVFYLIKKIPVSDDYSLKWKDVDEGTITSILVDDHDFSQERVENTIKKLVKEKEQKQQKGLGEFF